MRNNLEGLLNSNGYVFKDTFADLLIYGNGRIGILLEPNNTTQRDYKIKGSFILNKPKSLRCGLYEGLQLNLWGNYK